MGEFGKEFSDDPYLETREKENAFAEEAERVGLKNDDDVMDMIKELCQESKVK